VIGFRKWSAICPNSNPPVVPAVGLWFAYVRWQPTHSLMLQKADGDPTSVRFLGRNLRSHELRSPTTSHQLSTTLFFN
jgi:hypothetical protein